MYSILRYIFKINPVWVLLLTLHHCWLFRCVRLQLLDHIFAPLQLLPFNQTNLRNSSSKNVPQSPLGWLKLPLQERLSNRACSWDETKSVCSLPMHFIWSMATLHCFNSCNPCTKWYGKELKSRNSRNCICKSWILIGRFDRMNCHKLLLSDFCRNPQPDPLSRHRRLAALLQLQISTCPTPPWNIKYLLCSRECAPVPYTFIDLLIASSVLKRITFSASVTQAKQKTQVLIEFRCFEIECLE